MMRQLLLPLTIILVSTAILTATDWWEKKPFMEWSAGEVDQLLNDSPWSGVTPFSARIRTPISSYPISWRILLLSAKPVREAYLRRLSNPLDIQKRPDFEKTVPVGRAETKNGQLRRSSPPAREASRMDLDKSRPAAGTY